ncbi:MAG TPA: transcription antitermination factor NusB [Actinomycetota bacterium]|nr:transcription antitermination factor NusB [Actinomycetota bacterium]
MKSRRSARRMALGILYEAEIRGTSPLETWTLHIAPDGSIADPLRAGGVTDDHDADPDADAVEYARRLIQGVDEHQVEIDGHLTASADHWALDRMAVVDRNLLRIAVFELLWAGDIPVAVAINEAVELAQRFSTEDSGRFINGLLGRIAEKVTTGPEDP